MGYYRHEPGYQRKAYNCFAYKINMKVLMLTTSYPNKMDNRGIFIYNLVENLKKRGIAIDVLTITKYKELTSGAGIFSNLKKSWKARIQFPFYIIHFYFLIIKKVKKYDLIHANWGLQLFWLC